MGVAIDDLNNPDSEYIKAVEEIKDIIGMRLRMPLHRADFVFNNSMVGRRCNKLIEKTHRFTYKVRSIFVLNKTGAKRNKNGRQFPYPVVKVLL